MEIKKNYSLDTKWGTNRIFVTCNHYFTLRDYLDKDQKSLIYLVISDSQDKIRVNTHIKITAKNWDKDRKRLKKLDGNFEETNLILDSINAKLTSIKTQYHLQSRLLTAKQLYKQFQSETPDFDFISFYRHHLKFQNYKNQTVKNHNTVINKLEKFSKEIPFHEITPAFFNRYRKFYDYNSDITFQSDVKCIKTFLKLAEEEGVHLSVNLSKIKVNVEAKTTVYLLQDEVKQLLKYYFNEFINPSHILPLGYFLFSCYTGMRISDIKQRTREEILSGFFQFASQKNGSFQGMRLNEDAQKMILHHPKLFDVKLVDQKINFHLKKIAEVCKINKNLTMHVGRHTFATTFYRNTKDILRLKKLLGHSNIRHTMHYVHLVESENLDDIDFVTY